MSLRINLVKWLMTVGYPEGEAFKSIANAQIHEHKVVTITYDNGNVDTVVVNSDDEVVKYIGSNKPGNVNVNDTTVKAPNPPATADKSLSPEEQLKQFEEEMKVK